MKFRTIWMLVAIFALQGCVETRDPKTVSIKQSNDQNLSCRDIETEYKTNTEIATHKIEKNNDDDVKDIILGALIWPGLADFKNADGTEGNALLDRNVYLRQLSLQFNCNFKTWPEQPTRYS